MASRVYTESFNLEGHADFSPLEIERRIGQARSLLINSVLIAAVPRIFVKRQDYERFAEYLSDELRVHPRNFSLRGSSLLGFSFHPKHLWRQCSDDSDVDLAIVDADYYHMIDREIRHLETRPLGDIEAVRAGDSEEKRLGRRTDRKFYCYRYFNLPDLPAVASQKQVLKNVPSHLLDRRRSVDAFVFRDWWSVYSRWDSDLRGIQDGIVQRRMPHAPG